MFRDRSNSGIQPTRAVRPELAESGLAALGEKVRVSGRYVAVCEFAKCLSGIISLT